MDTKVKLRAVIYMLCARPAHPTKPDAIIQMLLNERPSFHIFPVTLSIEPFILLVSFFSSSSSFMSSRDEFSVTHTTGIVILMHAYK